MNSTQMPTKDFDALRRTVRQLREMNQRYLEALRTPAYKHGMGFNKDPRFSAFSLEVSFDSWGGYGYEDSVCATLIQFAAPDELTSAFVRYLDRHRDEIFAEIADDLATIVRADLDAQLAEAKARIAELEALSNEPMTKK